MAKHSLKRLIGQMDFSVKILRTEVPCQRLVYNVLNRYHSHGSKAENDENDVIKEAKANSQVPTAPKADRTNEYDARIRKYSSTDDESSDNKWNLELPWLPKALEPALQLCRWAMPTGNGFSSKSTPKTRSALEIVGSIQWSKLGLQDWSLSELTIGLYLIYLQQASTKQFEDVKGDQIFCDAIVHDLIYHTELAKGAYRDSAAGLARSSMLQESNVVKFVKDSSVMRPGYYIGIDIRKKLVILGIRGTHTVYDLITDIGSSSDEEVTVEGFSTHFGTAEAARWLLRHEIGTIKKYLEKYEGFRLRLVGHSLGGATASLLAIMLRKMSPSELGFNPDIVDAVGYATPPCVSRELAECCSEYVSTVVMQDDIIPRLSVASLTRLRNEILQTDWMDILQKEDWTSVVGLVTNAKQVVSSVQDVAGKLADYAKSRGQTRVSDFLAGKERVASSASIATDANDALVKMKKKDPDSAIPEELFVPGDVYYLKRNVEDQNSEDGKVKEYFSLWRRHPGQHFQRILLSGNLISDHKCDSHYYALRDVLKGLPGPLDETLFK